MISLLSRLLAALPPSESFASVGEFRARARDAVAPFSHPVDRAAAAGFLADRVGYAFAGGYQAALERLFPGADGATCLAASETGGAHPRAIATKLEPSGDGYTLTGTKTFATLASEADLLLVVASVGLDGLGKNRLRVARVPAGRSGVARRDRAPMAFAPEIRHAEVTFDRVLVHPSELLDGDGYDRWLKPFRTVEDVHVLAALVGHLVGVARAHAWPRANAEAMIAALLALREIGGEDPTRPEVHVALGGAIAQVRAIAAACDALFAAEGGEVGARWSRDRPLLLVADGARALRLESAWRSLASA